MSFFYLRWNLVDDYLEVGLGVARHQIVFCEKEPLISVTGVTGTILPGLALDGVNRGRVPRGQGIIVGNKVFGSRLPGQNGLEIAKRSQRVLLHGGVTNEIVFIGISRAPVDVDTNLEGFKRIGRENHPDVPGLFDIKGYMTVCAIEILRSVADRAGQFTFLMRVVHGHLRSARNGIGVTLFAAGGLRGIVALDSFRSCMVEFRALMTVRAYHLVFFIMCVRAGPQEPHVFACVTGAVAGVTRLFHGWGLLKAVTVEQSAFGHLRPGHMAAAAAGVTVGAVQLPGRRQKCIFHLIGGDNGADDILDAGEVVVHRILIR
jgi:hypothetical protein